jgi:hypothetical protein
MQRATLEHRRTPCVGICSTTYGDLICRGCKRFAHEIVSWNGYTVQQQGRVWQRLEQLRDGCVEANLTIFDESRLRDYGAGPAVPPDGNLLPEGSQTLPGRGSLLSVAYESLRHAPADVSLEMLGIRAVDPTRAARSSLREAIDQEFYRRSVAHYERSFKTSLHQQG